MDADSFLPEVARTPAPRLRSGSRLRTLAVSAVSAVVIFFGARSALPSLAGALQLSTLPRAPLAQSGPVLAPVTAIPAWTRSDVSAVRMRSDVRAALAEDPEAFYASVYEGAEADGVLCGAACRSILHSQGYPMPLRAAVGSRAGTPVMMGKPKNGIFTPVVKLTKRLMGEGRFKSFRADVISQHTKVIQAFVDTSETEFGCLALSKLFELADKDGSGSIDREELENALYTLGFTHLRDEQIDKILQRADQDDNCVLDYDEFVKEAPKTLKTNLVKLAKENGASLGFLS